MEKKYYNILWIDDEHMGMLGFKGDAKSNSIQLVPFKSLNEGINELKKNYTIYDGVLLDAKFFENEDDVKGSEDTINVHRAKEELLLIPKRFEVFVLTGQAEAYEDKTFNRAFQKVYRKGIDEDIEQLFIDIKTAADQQQDTQLKHKYSKAFQICNEKYLNNDREILHLANILEEENSQVLNKDAFTSIRKVMEKLFIKLHEFGVIPNKINDDGILNQKSYFITGTHKEFILKQQFHIDKSAAFLITTLLKITQDGSHIISRENALKIDDFVTSQQTQHLLKSSIHILFDILIYFKEYIDKLENSTEITYWVKIETSENEWIYGTVQESSNGWGNFYSDCCQYERISISQERMLKLNINEKIHIRLGSNPKYVGEIQEYPDI